MTARKSTIEGLPLSRWLVQYTNPALYVAALLLVLIHRLLILWDFGFRYTDSDQTIVWSAVVDFAHGNFHEPHFYGQAYSSMLEALFAVPFYWLGCPVYFALPLVSSLMTLFPFVAISFSLFRKQNILLSILVLVIPLTLSTDYALITTMPRGFLPGVFVASIGLLFTEKRSILNFALITFFAIVGFTANSNSIIFSGPVVLLYAFRNFRHPPYWLGTALGFALGTVLYYFSNRFYIKHPYYNLHKMEVSYSFELLMGNFAELDRFFNNTCPLFWNNGSAVLIILLIMLVALFRKRKYPEGITVAFTVLLIIGTTGIDKVQDGSHSIYMPYARMYLGIPPLLAFFTTLFSEPRRWKPQWVILIPVLYFIVHLQVDFPRMLEKTRRGRVVSKMKVNRLLDSCSMIRDYAKRLSADLVIINHNYLYDAYNYGCAACIEDFPETLRPEYERRTWRLIEEENHIHRNVLIIEAHRRLHKENSRVKKLRYSLFVFENNQKTTPELLKELRINCREYK